MIRFNHEANSWLVCDQYSGKYGYDSNWDYCTPYYARQMFDKGYILWID